MATPPKEPVKIVMLSVNPVMEVPILIVDHVKVQDSYMEAHVQLLAQLDTMEALGSVNATNAIQTVKPVQVGEIFSTKDVPLVEMTDSYLELHVKLLVQAVNSETHPLEDVNPVTALAEHVLELIPTNVPHVLERDF